PRSRRAIARHNPPMPPPTIRTFEVLAICIKPSRRIQVRRAAAIGVREISFGSKQEKRCKPGIRFPPPMKRYRELLYAVISPSVQRFVEIRAIHKADTQPSARMARLFSRYR